VLSLGAGTLADMYDPHGASDSARISLTDQNAARSSVSSVRQRTLPALTA